MTTTEPTAFQPDPEARVRDYRLGCPGAGAIMADQHPEAYRAGSRRLRLVTSQNAVHFLAEAHWPVTIQTGAGVGRIGRTAFIASTGLFVAGRCIGVCDTVLVMLGDDGPEPIPDAFRAALETAMVGSGATAP